MRRHLPAVHPSILPRDPLGLSALCVALVLAILLAFVLAAPGHAAPPGFTDVTAGSGVDFVHTFGDGEMSNLVESTGVGVCLLDFDGDGRLDIYFVNGAVLPDVSDPETAVSGPAPTNHLYRNVTEPGGPWRFEDVTASAGVGDTGYGMGCVAGDLDDDGDPDLVVTNYGPNKVYRNDGPDASGHVHFTDVTEEAGLADSAWSLGAALLDYDGDGRLDLYVGDYVVWDPGYHAFYVADRFPGPLSYPGSPDHLYRNVTKPGGPWRFEDVTASAGVGNPEGRAMGVGVLDYDGDGRPDVFVANDAMANSLFHNLGGGRFEDVGLVSGVAFSENGEATAAMGVESGDVDGDGRLDLLIPDMTYSTLYQGMPGQTFQDRSRRWGLAMAAAQFVGWSGQLIDYDLDGRPDLFLTTGDLHDFEPMEDVLLHNEGTQGGQVRLRDVSGQAGEHFRTPTMGRGAAVGDLDGDGDPDVVITDLDRPPVLLRNDFATGNHWLKVQTVGTRSNREGVGARVTVETGAGRSLHRQFQEVRAGSGYLSSSDPRLIFGLGPAKEAAKVTVRWPSGRVTVKEHVAADQLLVVEEGAP